MTEPAEPVIDALADGPQALLRLAERLLRGDAATVAAWRAAGLGEDDRGWTFGLAELHRHLHGDRLGYRAWRRQLYRSDLNTRLRALGGEFVMEPSRGKVALNRYRLRPLPR